MIVQGDKGLIQCTLSITSRAKHRAVRVTSPEDGQPHAWKTDVEKDSEGKTPEEWLTFLSDNASTTKYYI